MTMGSAAKVVFLAGLIALSCASLNLIGAADDQDHLIGTENYGGGAGGVGVGWGVDVGVGKGGHFQFGTGGHVGVGIGGGGRGGVAIGGGKGGHTGGGKGAVIFPIPVVGGGKGGWTSRGGSWTGRGSWSGACGACVACPPQLRPEFVQQGHISYGNNQIPNIDEVSTMMQKESKIADQSPNNQ